METAGECSKMNYRCRGTARNWQRSASRARELVSDRWNAQRPDATKKPFLIPKREVREAFKRVKANQGAAGVDGQSIEYFEANLSGNLYKPEVGVEQSGPGEASRAASGRAGFGVDVERQSPFLGYAGEQVRVVRALRMHRLQRDHVEIADVVLPHQRHGLGLQHLSTVGGPLPIIWLLCHAKGPSYAALLHTRSAVARICSHSPTSRMICLTGSNALLIEDALDNPKPAASRQAGTVLEYAEPRAKHTAAPTSARHGSDPPSSIAASSAPY
jgi:hypothetical protein